MSGAWKLRRVPPPPPPPEPKLCVVCKGFKAECIVPVGEGSAPMCWLCAHHVVDHGCELADAPTAECECLPHQIYPGRTPVENGNYFEISREDFYKNVRFEWDVPPPTKIEIDPRFVHGDLKHDGTDKVPAIEGHLFNHKTRQIEHYCSACHKPGHHRGSKKCPLT